MLNTNYEMTKEKFYETVKNLKENDIGSFTDFILSNFDSSYYDEEALIYEYRLKDGIICIKLVDFDDVIVSSMYQLGVLITNVDLLKQDDVKKINNLYLKKYYDVTRFALSFYDDEIISQVKAQVWTL